MKLQNIRLIQEPGKSFIVYHETHPFSRYHNHPEIELVLILKGKGKRIVGDHIDRFKENDLVLVGQYLPHEWYCDREYYEQPDGFQGEGIVYQFLQDFLGTQFFDIPENIALKRLINESNRGLEFHGKAKEKIMELMVHNFEHDDIDRLYSLLSIFRILSKTREYTCLSSPGFIEPFHIESNQSMHKAMKYIHQNFHREVTLKELLSVTSMSNTSFCKAFKKTYRMTFKEYLLNTRIGYACKLLTNDSLNISQIAYDSGFENISNFNRQFKKIKGITPTKFQDKLDSDQ